MSLAILGGTPGIADLKGRLERARELRSPVLLLAEPGSGEELCARYLHRMNTPWMVFGEVDTVRTPRCDSRRRHALRA